MKNYLISFVLLTAACQQLPALMNLGAGRVDLNLQLSSVYDTEIRSRDLGQEDFIFSVRPSLKYERPSKNFNLFASLGLLHREYMDYGEYSDTDVFFDLNFAPNAEIQTSRLRLSGDLILSSETITDDAVGDIVSVNTYGASAELLYDPNRLYDIIAGASYKKRDPQNSGSNYYTLEYSEASLTLLVPRSEKVNLSGGIKFRDTQSDRGFSDSKTFTYFAGINGTFTPKLSGGISAGLQNRKFDSAIEDATSPYISANLTWQTGELTTVAINASQGLSTTIDDRPNENMTISISANRSFSRTLSGSLFAGYIEDNYDSLNQSLVRDDKEYYLGGSLSYAIARWGSLSFDLRYSDQTSTQQIYEFDRIRAGVNLSATW